MYMTGSRRARTVRRTALTAGALLFGALLVAPPAARAEPTPSAPDPSIRAGVVTLRADLHRVAEQHRTGPAAMSEPDRAALDQELSRAVEQADDDPCKTAEALQAYSDRVGTIAARARKLAQEMAAAPGKAAELGQLRRATARYDELARQGFRLRGDALAGADDGCEGPITVYVDANKAKPRGPALPGWEDKIPRPVAALVDTDGEQTDFVADELVITSADDAAVKSFVTRRGGKILQVTDTKVSDSAPQYLVRVDGKRADPAKLSGYLAKLNDGKKKAESLSVSSEAGIEVLAAAAAEANGNLQVGVNWLTRPDSIASGSTREAVTSTESFNAGPYNRNAYTWHYLNSGSVQNIGTAPAWTLLDSINRADNTVEIGIVDKGFRPAVSNDLPAGTTMTSVVPFVSADAAGDSSSPWHGTDAADTAAGVPDNNRGAAGSAGPVGRLNLVYSSYDFFTAINGVGAAAARGSKIINMSFGARVHWSLERTILPFEGVTASLRAAGILLFASAGNDGRDVDNETCFLGACWEKHWVTPCENAGVRCVGGLGKDSLNRATNSNYGHEDVDIFAPYSVLVGPNPAVPADGAHRVNGTSFASPYTAGVAALIWAANPGLSAGSVETILFRNMRTSPDDKVKRRVINALGAVQDALPAVIAIKAPADGATINAGPTQFRANVFADGHGTPTITWKRGTSNFGTGTPVTATLPPGTHDVTATATWSDGTVATDKIRVTVVNHAPTVHIVSPNDDTTVPTYGQSEAIPFQGTSFEPDGGSLTNSQVSWRLDGATTAFATGHNPTVPTNATPGLHTITFRGCDAFGACGSDTVQINIRANGPNLPPSVQITNPVNGANLGVNGSDANGTNHQLTLGQNVSDPEGGPLTMVWTDNGVQIATGPSPTVRLRGQCETFGHTLTLTVTDNAGNTRSHTVEVTVIHVC